MLLTYLALNTDTGQKGEEGFALRGPIGTRGHSSMGPLWAWQALRASALHSSADRTQLSHKGIPKTASESITLRSHAVKSFPKNRILFIVQSFEPRVRNGRC